jgi:hypothetical protein
MSPADKTEQATLHGRLTHAGTMDVSEDKDITGVFVSCSVDALRSLRGNLLYEDVAVVRRSDLAAAVARAERAEARALTWHKGPALGGVGTAGEDNGVAQWYDGDHLIIIVDVKNQRTGDEYRETAVVYLNADEDVFEVRDASTHDIYDAWSPEAWSWWAKLDGKYPEDAALAADTAAKEGK